MPANYGKRIGRGVAESSIGDLHLTYHIDDELNPKIWLLTWQFASRAQVDAIWQHYDQHSIGSFKWKPPVIKTLRTFQWFSPPSIQWTTPVSASVTGEIEQLLAFIP